MPRSSQYAFTLANFVRMVRKADRQEKQLKLFVEQRGLFVDRDITAILEPYKHLHTRMDDMEARGNDRLKDLIVSELERFVAELKKAQDDVLKLQKERAIVSLESPILITPPLATETAPPDPLSATVTTDATLKVHREAPPQTVIPNSGA
ncbi:hypothetical protein HAX54_045094 [Datura stramonium]|uniref:Uncharacterized protein n=1 Tax=Datura stramonium TaxID=4076 RepID=A0ABS8WH78_DATST|nr:hypothetical protein [Datura stramonium]